MIQYLAMTQVNQLNMFPVKGGISSYYSPHVIMGGTSLDYNKHCVVPFGTYVQANHKEKKRNTPAPRMIDCIYLHPSNNLQGGHDLMSLHTGELIQHGGKITEVPITQVVIDAVECMAKKEGFKSLKFKDRNKVVFFDTDWIAGVDFDNENEQDEEYDKDNDYINEDEEDIEYEEEVNQDEIDELNEKDEEVNPTVPENNKNNDDVDEDQEQDNNEEADESDEEAAAVSNDSQEINVKDANEEDEDEDDKQEMKVNEPR